MSIDVVIHLLLYLFCAVAVITTTLAIGMAQHITLKVLMRPFEQPLLLRTVFLLA